MDITRVPGAEGVGGSAEGAADPGRSDLAIRMARGVCRRLLDLGYRPLTEFTLECAAGLLRVRAYCDGGKARSVEITNVASFADKLDAALEVEGLPTLCVDTAYGGDSFVLVDAQALGFKIAPDEARDMATLGARITRAANEQLGFSHPLEPWNHISFCQFTAPVQDDDGVRSGLSAVVIDPGKIDRSPCGTGCSARLATMAARGEIAGKEARHPEVECEACSCRDLDHVIHDLRVEACLGTHLQHLGGGFEREGQGFYPVGFRRGRDKFCLGQYEPAAN